MTVSILGGLFESDRRSGRKQLIVPSTEFDNASIIGQMAHIYAFSNQGPRPNPTAVSAQKNDYENLILLCGNHHRPTF